MRYRLTLLTLVCVLTSMSVAAEILTVAQATHSQCAKAIIDDLGPPHYHLSKNFTVKGLVQRIAECPICPANARCKPCPQGFYLVDTLSASCAQPNIDDCKEPLLFIPFDKEMQIGKLATVTYEATTRIEHVTPYDLYLRQRAGGGDIQAMDAQVSKEVISLADAQKAQCHTLDSGRIKMKLYVTQIQIYYCPPDALCEPTPPDGLYLVDTPHCTQPSCTSPMAFLPLDPHKINAALGDPVLVELSREQQLKDVQWGGEHGK